MPQGEEFNPTIEEEIAVRLWEESFRRALGVEVTEVLARRGRLPLVRRLGDIAHKELLRPFANQYLREVSLDLLGIEWTAPLPVEERATTVWATDLGKTALGLNWNRKSSFVTIEWEKGESAQLFRIPGSDKSAVFAEVERRRVQLNHNRGGNYVSEPYSYWFDPSDPNPSRDYRRRPEDRQSRPTRQRLKLATALQLIHNLQTSKPQAG